MAAIPSSDHWIVRRKMNPQAHLRLFCFPYAGGGASIYHGWARELPSFVDVCPVQLPGRENRLIEPPFTRFEALLQALTQGLRPHLDLPFAFFGHSMGAIISFELARRLRREHRSPLHLFASGSPAPQVPYRDPPIHELPEAEFIEELRKLNGTPDAVLDHPELLQLLLPVIRADFGMRALYAYTPGSVFDFPITAFGGVEDADVPQDDVVAWGEHTRGAFTLHMVPGDHFFIHGNRERLLQLLSDGLIQIQSRMSSG